MRELFTKGQWREIDSHCEKAEARLETEDLVWWLGALTFLGQTEKAEALDLRLRSRETDPFLAQVQCFFTVILLVRQSRYDEARSRLRGVLVAARQRPSPGATPFYLWQSLAFYHFFFGRFRKCSRYARKALLEAHRSRERLLQMLSADLLGHSLIQLGQIRRGLKLIEEGEELARSLGSDSFERTLRMARVTYQNQFGLDCRDSFRELEELFAEYLKEPGSLGTEMCLEMAHQLWLRGRSSEAERSLQQAADKVYRWPRPRVAALLNFRWAHLLANQGRHFEALHLLRTAAQTLNPKVDRPRLCAVQGLEVSILIRLGRADEARELSERLAREVDTSFVHQRILARQAGRRFDLPRGEDRLGDWIEDLRHGSPQALKEILEEGFFGLLPYAFSSLPEGRLFFLNLSPKMIVERDGGDWRAHPPVPAGQLRKLLLAIADGVWKKSELIRRVWGYEYDSERHDPLLKRAVQRLRKPLGSALETIEGGYRLAPHTRVFLDRPKIAPTPILQEERTVEPAPTVAPETDDAELNDRQIQVLKLLRRRQWISIGEYAEIFTVSKPTATRDLCGLVRLGRCEARGKARATRYRARMTPP